MALPDSNRRLPVWFLGARPGSRICKEGDETRDSSLTRRQSSLPLDKLDRARFLRKHEDGDHGGCSLPHADPKPLCVAAYRESHRERCVRVSLANWLRAHGVGLSVLCSRSSGVAAGVSFDLYRNRWFIRAFAGLPPCHPFFLPSRYRPLRTTGMLGSEPPNTRRELSEEGSCAPGNAGWVARGTCRSLASTVE